MRLSRPERVEVVVHRLTGGVRHGTQVLLMQLQPGGYGWMGWK